MSSAPAYPARAGVVILNYNGWRDTIDCVLSVLRVPEPIWIVVVDNASPDGSDERIQAWAREALPAISAVRVEEGLPRVAFQHLRPGETLPDVEGRGLNLTLIQAGRNGGYAAGNNVGIRFALAKGCEFVWLLNNDTTVERDALTWLLARVREDPRIGLCGSTLVHHDRPDTVQALAGSRFRRWRGWSVEIGSGMPLTGRPGTLAVESQLSYVNGASTLVSRAFIEAVGLMEESYFLYWEEIDWSFRAQGRFRLGYAPDSIVRHKVGASIGTRHHGRQSLLADFYMLRGAVLFCLRYSWISLPAVLLGSIRDMVHSASSGEWSRVRHKLRALAGRHYPADRKDVPSRTARRHGET